MTDLPAGWEMRRLKTVAQLRTSNVDKKKVDGEAPVRLCNYTDVYYSETIASADGFMEATATPEEIARFHLRRDDVLVTKDSESRDDIAVPAYVARDLPDVLCGYHLALLRPRKEVVDGRFLHYCFLEGRVAHQFTVGANGITRFGLSQDVLNDARLPVPPLPIQRAVASFLDRETEKIDTLVEKKRRLLELLEEKRTALITRAVTKGLDPDVPMKDSGVEWLGEVPEHWEVLRGRSLFSESDERSGTGEHELLTVSHRTGVLPRSEHAVNMIQAESHEDHKVCRPDDVVVNTMWAWMGGVGVSGHTGMVSPSYNVYKIRSDRLLSGYYEHVCRSPSHVAEMKRWSKGIWRSRLRLYPEAFLQIRLPLPPVEEQANIVSHCSLHSQQSAILKARISNAISLLREYRTALISAAVTGKIDVTTESAA